MSDVALAERVAAVRRFNRFYTRRIGVLREGLLGSELSLAEARVLYELAQRKDAIAAELGSELSLDAGYLSRLLRGLERRGFIRKRPCATDGRRSLLSLTERGRDMFATLDARSRDEIAGMLGRLPAAEQERLVKVMRAVEDLLGDRREPGIPCTFRTHQPGDMGWIVHRHGVLYAEEHGWDETFEAFVAEIAAGFVRRFKPKRERCWVAERDGEIVGSVFLVEESEKVAKLRLLYVEPGARGLGIGRRLVDECLRFARRAGYAEVTLWTNDVLVAARRVYEAAGFRLAKEERHRSFGHDLVGQNWRLDLTVASPQAAATSVDGPARRAQAMTRGPTKSG